MFRSSSGNKFRESDHPFDCMCAQAEFSCLGHCPVLTRSVSRIPSVGGAGPHMRSPAGSSGAPRDETSARRIPDTRCRGPRVPHARLVRLRTGRARGVRRRLGVGATGMPSRGRRPPMALVMPWRRRRGGCSAPVVAPCRRRYPSHLSLLHPSPSHPSRLPGNPHSRRPPWMHPFLSQAAVPRSATGRSDASAEPTRPAPELRPGRGKGASVGRPAPRPWPGRGADVGSRGTPAAERWPALRHRARHGGIKGTALEVALRNHASAAEKDRSRHFPGAEEGVGPTVPGAAAGPRSNCGTSTGSLAEECHTEKFSPGIDFPHGPDGGQYPRGAERAGRCARDISKAHRKADIPPLPRARAARQVPPPRCARAGLGNRHSARSPGNAPGPRPGDGGPGGAVWLSGLQRVLYVQTPARSARLSQAVLRWVCLGRGRSPSCPYFYYGQGVLRAPEARPAVTMRRPALGPGRQSGKPPV